MLWRMLRGTASAHGERVAFREGGRSISFSRLVEEAEGLASLLARGGIAPGDRVAIVLRNGLDLARATCGVLARGAVAVPLNPQLKPPEIERCLAACDPRWAFVHENFTGDSRAALLRAGLAPDRIAAVPAAAAGSGGFEEPEVDPDRAAFDLFSTGSTGRPKRVARTHGMLAADAEAYQAAARLTPADAIAGVAPLFHSYGISCVLGSVIRSGASATLFKEFAGEELLKEITERRCTIYPGSAFHFSLLADMTARADTDLSSLRLCFSCGLGLPASVEKKFRGRYGVPVFQMYGATECSSATMNLEGDHESLIESAGRALPGIAVRVFRLDGTEAEAGETGEVGVRGPAVAGRYEDIPDLSAQTFRDGWFRSGDLGRLDSAGNLKITGRIKLMINAAGNKVDPLEVEEVLCEHPGVAEAAVVGVPGPHALEIVKAVIVRRGEVGERELREFCRERLVPYKIPRLIQFVEKLPRSPTGKLLRKDLLD